MIWFPGTKSGAKKGAPGCDPSACGWQDRCRDGRAMSLRRKAGARPAVGPSRRPLVSLPHRCCRSSRCRAWRGDRPLVPQNRTRMLPPLAIRIPRRRSRLPGELRGPRRNFLGSRRPAACSRCADSVIRFAVPAPIPSRCGPGCERFCIPGRAPTPRRPSRRFSRKRESAPRDRVTDVDTSPGVLFDGVKGVAL